MISEIQQYDDHCLAFLRGAVGRWIGGMFGEQEDDSEKSSRDGVKSDDSEAVPWFGR